MPAAGGDVLTIGHSTHPLATLLELLGRHGVTAVGDVRAAPWSRFNPQFNREPLRRYLAERGITYVFLGAELGGRSDDPACYEEGRIQYDRLRGTDSFRRGLDRIVRGAARHRVALLCAEKEPLECHRCLLVSQELVARKGFDARRIGHIGPDGRLESHADAMDRLLALHGMPEGQPSLFGRGGDALARAIARQARRFGHRRETSVGAGGPPGRGAGEATDRESLAAGGGRDGAPPGGRDDESTT